MRRAKRGKVAKRRRSRPPGPARVEETIRFVKQSYQVEDMRTLTMTRLRNLAYPPKHEVRVAKRCSGRGALVLAVAYFVMVWIGKSERREVLRTHIVETAKRIYGAPEFFYYAHPC